MTTAFEINTHLDPKDQAILASRVTYRELRAGPRVGDFCIMADGSLRRFAHDWGKDIQTTSKDESGSFYLNDFGELSHSGGLEPGLPKSRIVRQEGLREGSCWFFHHDRAFAHNGVQASIPCRVYVEVV
jgi:hypothetical protein